MSEHAKPAARSGQQPRSWGTTIAVAVVVVFAAAVGIGLYVAQQPTEAVVPPNATAEGVVVGPADAPVTIDVYEDFQCPACRQFHGQTGLTLHELATSGRARVIYHPVAYLDRASSTHYSSRASAAAGCAAEAGVFPRFAGLLFAHQPSEGGAGLSTERLVELGRQAGATGGGFADCVRGQRYADWTADLTDAASQQGITAVPTVLVNGEPVSPPTPAELRQAVAQAG